VLPILINQSIEAASDVTKKVATRYVGGPGIWLLLCAKHRISLFIRDSLLVMPEGSVALVHSGDVDAGRLDAFYGTVLLINEDEISPHDRKLLMRSKRNSSFASGWSRLLCAYLESLDEETLRFVYNNESDWSLVKHQIMALLRRTLREQLKGARYGSRHQNDGEGVRLNGERLFEDICGWVVANLTNPEMSLGFVASHFQVSLRSIQSLFSNHGDNITFVSFLRKERLLLARKMLTDANHAHQTISEISWNCGFSDPVYFGKIFRKFYGEAPGQVRRRYLNGDNVTQ